jgi:hypothetical protein
MAAGRRRTRQPQAMVAAKLAGKGRSSMSRQGQQKGQKTRTKPDFRIWELDFAPFWRATCFAFSSRSDG